MRSCWDASLGVTEFATVIATLWVTLVVLLASDWNVNKPTSGAQLQLLVWPSLWQSMLWIRSHFLVLLKTDLCVQQTHLIPIFLSLSFTFNKPSPFLSLIFYFSFSLCKKHIFLLKIISFHGISSYGSKLAKLFFGCNFWLFWIN